MFNFDNRTTAEIENSRSYDNRKPYRSKKLKIEAKEKATKRSDGTWRCEVKKLYHSYT